MQDEHMIKSNQSNEEREIQEREREIQEREMQRDNRERTVDTAENAIIKQEMRLRMNQDDKSMLL
jgi:hypothetical protein